LLHRMICTGDINEECVVNFIAWKFLDWKTFFIRSKRLKLGAMAPMSGLGIQWLQHRVSELSTILFDLTQIEEPLSSHHGTYKPIKARFRPWSGPFLFESLHTIYGVPSPIYGVPSPLSSASERGRAEEMGYLGIQPRSRWLE